MELLDISQVPLAVPDDRWTWLTLVCSTVEICPVIPSILSAKSVPFSVCCHPIHSTSYKSVRGVGNVTEGEEVCMRNNVATDKPGARRGESHAIFENKKEPEDT